MGKVVFVLETRPRLAYAGQKEASKNQRQYSAVHGIVMSSSNSLCSGVRNRRITVTLRQKSEKRREQDMSVNTYTKGCHLLNHDDVIGTRRVSYILYMPLPHYQGWQDDWGGALELYPVKEGKGGVPEPEPIPSKCIPPSWNQFIFFEVQPGRSFHSVEEVVVGEGEDGRQRLSISGWFHAAQSGEEGHDPTEVYGEYKSSREQLVSAGCHVYDNESHLLIYIYIYYRRRQKQTSKPTVRTKSPHFLASRSQKSTFRSCLSS